MKSRVRWFVPPIELSRTSRIRGHAELMSPETAFEGMLDPPAAVVIRPADTGIKCEKCGRTMAIRRGQRGPYLACTGYPDCRNFKRIGGDGTMA